MSNAQKLYLAATGMITSIGESPEVTAASVRAGISGYTTSEYENQHGEFITMAGLPDEVYDDFEVEIDEGLYYSELYDRIIKMAILAAAQVFQRHPVPAPIPFILSVPETLPHIRHITPEALLDNLVTQAKLPIDRNQVRTVQSGRAAVIHGLDLAERFLYDLQHDYVLVGASDSYWHYPIVADLDEAGRAMAVGEKDAFVPGEGACFLLLTRHPEKALVQDGHIIALCPAGVAEEPGHRLSDQPYLGEGLHQAFQQALQGYQGDGIHSVYSSMNGEHYWAKEYGVAMTRHQQHFCEDVKHQHPVDCFGDLGAATGSALIALAAEDLRKHQGPATHLVYASSDSSWRAALRVEKIPLQQNVS